MIEAGWIYTSRMQIVIFRRNVGETFVGNFNIIPLYYYTMLLSAYKRKLGFCQILDLNVQRIRLRDLVILFFLGRYISWDCAKINFLPQCCRGYRGVCCKERTAVRGAPLDASQKSSLNFYELSNDSVSHKRIRETTPKVYALSEKFYLFIRVTKLSRLVLEEYY